MSLFLPALAEPLGSWRAQRSTICVDASFKRWQRCFSRGDRELTGDTAAESHLFTLAAGVHRVAVRWLQVSSVLTLLPGTTTIFIFLLLCCIKNDLLTRKVRSKTLHLVKYRILNVQGSFCSNTFVFWNQCQENIAEKMRLRK